MKVNVNHPGQMVALLWIFFAGCWLPYSLYHITLQYYKVKNYKPVKATVLSYEIKEHKRYRRGAGFTYEPIIKYKYLVDGKEFISNKILAVKEFPFRDGDTESWSIKIIQKYNTEADVTAYYNPKKPGSSFLVRDILFSPYGKILIDTSIIFLSCFIFIMLSCQEYWDKLDKRYSGHKWHWAISNSNTELIVKIMALCLCYSSVIVLVWYSYTSIVIDKYNPAYAYVYYCCLSLNVLPMSFLIYRALKNNKGIAYNENCDI